MPTIDLSFAERYDPPEMPRLALARHYRIIGGLLALVGGSGGCQGAGAQCSCSTAGALITQPALSSPVASVAADPPCVALPQPGPDGGSDVLVEVTAKVAADTGSCQVRETLADGSVLVAELSFARVDAGGCCAGTTMAVGSAPTFAPAGGGAQ